MNNNNVFYFAPHKLVDFAQGHPAVKHSRGDGEKKMSYQIAFDNGRTGHNPAAFQASIYLGLKKGYDGFIQEKAAVLNFLTGLYTQALKEGKGYVAFVITDAVITYAYKSGEEVVAMHEPSLVLATTQSPLYTTEGDEAWKASVEDYAAKLAAEFGQFRVYVEYARTEIKIFQQS